MAGLRIGYLKAAFEADHATKAFDEVTRSNRDDQMVQPMAGVDLFVTPSFGGNVVQITNLTGHLIAVGEAYQGATDFHRKHPPKFS